MLPAHRLGETIAAAQVCFHLAQAVDHRIQAVGIHSLEDKLIRLRTCLELARKRVRFDARLVVADARLTRTLTGNDGCSMVGLRHFIDPGMSGCSGRRAFVPP
jgi:hypothetical protein